MSEDQAPLFHIQRVYLKDLSLEIPNAPQIFLEQEAPNLEVQLNVGQQLLVDSLYEVTITITLTTKVGDKVAFLVEAKQAGIFQIQGVPAEQLDPVLGIICPNIIYPYARSNVADVVQRAGFPPVHLQEVNFEALYQQRLQDLQQQKNGSSGLMGLDGNPLDAAKGPTH